MKKRLKGLLSLWLAVVMVCGMMVMPAMASGQPIYVYKGGNSITDDEYYDIENPNVSYSTTLDELGNIPLNQQSFVREIAVPEGSTITGWNAWGVNGSGYVCGENAQKNLPATYILNSDTISTITEFGDHVLLEALFGDGTGVHIGGRELPVAGYYKYNDGFLNSSSAGDYNAYLVGSDTEGYTLTINGLTVTGEEDSNDGKGIYSEGGLNLVLVGENTVTGADDADGNSFGVLTQNGLTISGSGSLTATAGRSGIYSVGIDTLYGNMIIESGTINAAGGAVTNGYSFGIGVSGNNNETGNLAISGGNITATGGTATSGNSFGIGATGTVTITGGTVTVKGGIAYNGNSLGIGANKDITITGGTVKATGGQADSVAVFSLRSFARRTATENVVGNSLGLGTDGNILICGDANVTAIGGVASASSLGMGAKGTIIIGCNAVVNAKSDDAYVNSCGIVANGITIQDRAEVIATSETVSGPTAANTTNGNSYGLASTGTVLICDKARVTLRGGESVDGKSFGLGAEDDVTISGNATLEANGGSYGIGTLQAVKIGGQATVTASGNDQAIGAVSEEGVTINPGNYILYADGVRVYVISDWSLVQHFVMTQGSAGSSGDSGSSGASSSSGSGGGHTCTSKCEVCGGCEDLSCTRSACKTKCTLLTMSFNDVEPGKWYAEAVGYVYHHGLMAGVGNNLFGINETTTRAMVVTILWNLENKPVVNYAMSFEDVPSDVWYTEAVRWAAAEGVVAGYGDMFGPNDPVTREQLATILWNYAKYKGYDVSVGENTNILSYKDAFDISEWAFPAMQWACGEGVMSGKGDGILDPGGFALRVETAQMLQNFLED